MNTTTTPTRLLPLTHARHRISDGDLLLFRRRSLISIAGRGTHSHAAKAGWWDGELFCLEVREWHGGRAVTLESQVKSSPHESMSTTPIRQIGGRNTIERAPPP